MTPRTILYVDDEALALKYFSRLIEPLAPVLTATSVAEGQALLAQHAAQIAVLVTDQRMPGARGNELLEHARLHHPAIVRMLTTAYSDLGEAVAAVNRGEIYRYISKPWDADALRTDLANALELAQLRHERDALLRDKMLVTGRQVLGQRAALLRAACGGMAERDAGLHRYFGLVAQAGAALPVVDWQRLDQSDWLQAESARMLALAHAVGQHLAQWPALPADAAAATAQLAASLGADAERQADAVVLPTGRATLCAPLQAAVDAPLAPATSVLLAWVCWWPGGANVVADGETLRLGAQAAPAAALSADWLAADIERLWEASVAQP
jgi:two-component system probable response regulator PhcQ